MTDALLPATPQPLEKENDGYFRKGCNPLAQTGRSKLQNQRAALNQQILKAVRMRTGAENLLKVATNPKVREQARLELSFVNSDLQILKEELEGLNISLGVYQNTEEAFTIPLIPLGLKETKDIDFSVILKVNLKAPNSVFKMEIGHLWWYMPVVPVTWEAEARGLLEPIRKSHGCWLPSTGKSHLRRALTHHEESVREASLCKKLRSIEVLQKVLSAAQERSRLTHTQHREDDDLLNLIDAPDVVAKTEQEVEIILPQFSKLIVTDFFQKLGPLSVFSANKRWTPPRSIRFTAEEGDLGFTLRGNAPVQVHFLDPYCSAAVAGAREGDYIVSIQLVDCKWLTVSEVMKLLKSFGENEIQMEVVSLLDSTSSMHNKCATYSVGMQKTYSMICLAIEDDDKTDKTKKISKKLSFLSWGTNKNRQKSASTLCLPSVGVARPQIKKKLPSPFSLLNSDSSLY
ncbi:rhophilin-2 [Sapajus apella]|uniref:Rhophilin-2 n=1 Tax=Sapajus apella TaxID=9515 RepID=A0A6J3FHB9_SAPAP|nr:rhophilin-2 [Sapajus apella]